MDMIKEETMDIKELTELLIEKGYEFTFRPVPMKQSLIQLILLDQKSNRQVKVMVDVTTSGTLYEDPVFETMHMMIEAMDSYRRGTMNRVVWEGWTVKDFINYIEPATDQIMWGFSNRKPFKSKAEMAKYVTDEQPYYKMPIPEVIEYFANKYGLK